MFKRFRKWMSYDTPYALGLSEWGVFYKEFKHNAPVRYFIMIFIPQSIINPISRKYERIMDYFRYRFIPKHRYHIINTGLPPAYHETAALMLHASFTLLKDFVEKEKSQMWRVFGEEDHKDADVLSNKERGVKYLDWEASLDDPSSPDYDVSFATRQSIPGEFSQPEAARETRELYLWWTDIRPARKDAWSIMPDFVTGKSDLLNTTPSFLENIVHRKVADICYERSNSYEKEDTDMLVRLVKLRNHLWT